MKKQLFSMMVALGFLTTAAICSAQSEPQGTEKELRPSQKIMQARASWMKAMNSNLSATNFVEVQKDAKALAAQATTVGEKQPEGLGKELTIKLATLATGTADAADKKDEAAVKGKLAEMQAVCAECHAKIRDKK
jgi:hypothetical protein